jgi:isocitrate dehydrogenase
LIFNLGGSPEKLPKSTLELGSGKIRIPDYVRRPQQKELVGVDVFIDWQGSDPDEIGDALANIEVYKLKLKMITNRGVKVYPEGMKETYCTDHWRCRFVGVDADINRREPDYASIDFEQVVALLSKLYDLGFDVIKTENLYEFDGKRGFSLGQGE